MKRIARSAIVEHAALEVYTLVERIEAYPEFLPWCRAAQVRERDPGRTLATLAVGLKGARYEFTTENANRPGEAIDMRLVEGPFRHFAAHWRFVPLAAHASRVEFSMEYQFAGGIAAKVLAPVFAAIALFAYTGIGDEQTDIFGHLFGLLSGLCGGIVVAHFDARRLGRIGQFLSGAAAFGIVVAAWWLAG